MARFHLLFCIALSVQIGFSQNLYFSQNNYTDSIAFKNNLPELAKQAIIIYKKADTTTYYKDLGYLYLASQQYDKVNESFNRYANSFHSFDASQKTILEMPARVYCQTIVGDEMQFEKNYITTFNKLYQNISNDAALDVEFYYDVAPGEKSNQLSATINELKNSDSLSIQDAVKLCYVYSQSLVFADKPLGIAKSLLKKIADAKYIRDDSVLVKMPDGGIISLTIVRKKGDNTPMPVVLLYNIYAGYDYYDCKEAVNHGYIGIVANTRGKRLSPDAIEPLEHDASDAYYIIDWISKQPWCNGKVGMYGGSYLGFAQWASVKYLHPALKTIVPQVPVGAGIDFPMQNGIFMSYSLRWLHYVMDNKLTDSEDFRNTGKWQGLLSNWFKIGSSFRSLDSLEGRPNYIFQRWLQHPFYDRYWQSMTPQKQEFAKINIPVLTITGYWDDDQLGAMYYYKQHNLWNKNAASYLLIGPYDHSGSQGYPHKNLAGYKIDSVADIPIFKIAFQWMDYVLKDSARPAILKDRVNFELMGKNEWKHVSSLNEMHNDSLILYFGNNPNGTNQHSLLKNKPVKLNYIEQEVDFKIRTDIRFKEGAISAFEKLVDTTLNPEKEKLIFISEPIEIPFAISGSIKASIKASINKKDIDLVMDLYEQTPDGKYLALNENLQRASYANDRTKRQLLHPGEIETINMNNTFITSRQLQKGSRIIVLIGANKSPEWQVNYGTGKDVSDETMKDATVPLQIKWYNTSYIQFPILK